MIKPIRFTLFLVSFLATLMIFSNLATIARANSARNIETTPIPTMMPTETLLGEIPSTEEQEALKTVVQAYIEIRYRALSVAGADDFEQKGFGDWVSDLPEAGSFLREEKAKLAVQIKHAELDQLRYVKYKIFLNFRSIKVDPDTQTATVSVVEGNEVVYEISQELNPGNPIVSHTGGIEHTILLRKEQDGWKIISDSSHRTVSRVGAKRYAKNGLRVDQQPFDKAQTDLKNGQIAPIDAVNQVTQALMDGASTSGYQSGVL